MCSSPSASAGTAHKSTAVETAAISFLDILFSFAFPLLSWSTWSFGASARDQERYRDEQYRHQQQDGGDGIDLRCHRSPDLVPDVEGQGCLAGACDKLGNGEVVEGDDEGERRTR